MLPGGPPVVTDRAGAPVRVVATPPTENVLDRWLVRLSSPTAVRLLFVGTCAAAGLWWSGDPAGASTLRFMGIALATASVALGFRMTAAGRQRGTLPEVLATAPLPYFDDELAVSALRRLSNPVSLRAGAGACVALAGLGVVAFLCGREPLVRGVVDVGQGTAAEAWTPSGIASAPRTLTHSVRLAGVEPGSPPAATFELAPLDTRQVVRTTVAPLGRIEAGNVLLQWTSVTAGTDAGAARLTVTDRESGASETLTVGVGASVAATELEDVTVTIVEASPNRLAALGPAVHVRVTCGDAVEEMWLHAAAPEFQSEQGGGCVGVVLEDIEPTVSARLGVVDGPNPLLFPIAGFLLAVLVGSLGAGLVRPVFVRGRSGDYELVALRALTAAPELRLSRTAEQLLDSSRLAEWHRLRKSLAGPRGRRA